VVTVAAERLDEAAVLDALREVPDPEIPAISVVDLGVIGRIDVDDTALSVQLLPTFVGCPALEPMREAVRERLKALAPDRRVTVDVSFETPWTSDRISAHGRQRLTASGFGPPLPNDSGQLPNEPGQLRIALDQPVPCPFCGSRRTVLENAFGPTLCRSIRYCTDCRQPFEQFKQL
jgi:ring-1,2-phenylacetyl-CoA epoxidase subunit PaaD